MICVLHIELHTYLDQKYLIWKDTPFIFLYRPRPKSPDWMYSLNLAISAFDIAHVRSIIALDYSNQPDSYDDERGE